MGSIIRVCRPARIGAIISGLSPALLVLTSLRPLRPRIVPVVFMMVFHFAAFARVVWIKPSPESLRNVAGAACLGLGLTGSPAAAQGSEREWHLTAYGSQWVDADLLEIPERAVT